MSNTLFNGIVLDGKFYEVVPKGKHIGNCKGCDLKEQCDGNAYAVLACNNLQASLRDTPHFIFRLNPSVTLNIKSDD